MTTRQALTELANRLERKPAGYTLDAYQTAGQLSFICGPNFQDIRQHVTDLLAATDLFDESYRNGRRGVRQIAAVARHLS